jgi:phosphoglycolate phosphatase-like HAD superfamily hydrolase
MDKSDLIKDIIHENKLKDCLYVGDTTEDIDSAHKAGLKCAVVIYGFGNNIKNYKADYFLEKFEEVLYAYIKT